MSLDEGIEMDMKKEAEERRRRRLEVFNSPPQVRLQLMKKGGRPKEMVREKDR
ncbi:MAG: hypothetical protein WCK39_10865 [Methanomassiliicoccales archaeon]